MNDHIRDVMAIRLRMIKEILGENFNAHKLNDIQEQMVSQYVLAAVQMRIAYSAERREPL